MEYSIPEWELLERFVLASGPGGQNVNKVATAVQLRWNVDRSSLPAVIKVRFRRFWKTRITTDGDIIITAGETRSQARNRVAARARLNAMLEKAVARPKPRIATRVPAGTIARRLKAKKMRSEIKTLRKTVRRDDD